MLRARPIHEIAGLSMTAVRVRELGLFNPVSAVISAGSFVVSEVSDLPADIAGAIADLAEDLYDRFRDFTGLFADALKLGFKELFEGIRKIAELHWRLLMEQCALFRRFKDEINIAVQVAQGDYVSAGANLAAEAAEALGVEVPIPRNEAAAVRAGEFVCDALDTLNQMAEAAGTELPPVVVGETREQFLRRVTRDQRFAEGRVQALAPLEKPQAAPRPSRGGAIVIGGAAIAALMLLR